MSSKEHEKLMKSLESLEVKEFGVEKYGTETRKYIYVYGLIYNKVNRTEYHACLWLDPRTLFPVRFSCECPDFTFRIRMCKHLMKLYLTAIKQLKNKGAEVWR